MCNPPHDIDIGLSRRRLPEQCHICYVYNDDQERRDFIARLITEGLARGESVCYLADVVSPQAAADYLVTLGIDVPAQARDRLNLRMADQAYCPDGRFVPDRMLDTLHTLYTDSVARGLSGARVSGEMTWALKGRPGSDLLVSYEARINLLVDTAPILAVCQYDARRFDGAVIFDILSVHPMMVVRGQVVRNPYYVRPEEFLPRLATRV